MKIIRNAIAAGLLAAASVAACSSQHGATGTTAGSKTNTQVGSNGQSGTVGKVAMSWQIGTGITLTDLKWTISGGPGGSYGPLDIPIGTANSAEAVAGGITAGCGYVISIQGADSNGDPCSGTSASFCVNAGTTAYEQIGVVCLEPTDGQVSADVNTGSVAIEAGVTLTPVAPYACPGITSFSIAPAELLGSQTGAVAIQTTGTVSSIHWTTGACMTSPGQGDGSGTVAGFANPSAASTTFSCGTCMGQAQIQATVEYDQVQPGSDAATSVCAGAPFTTFTGLINCEGGGGTVCFPPTTLCGGMNGTCVNETNDPNNCGACGAVCPAGLTCANSACACPSGETLVGSTCCPAGDNLVCGGTCTNNQTDNANCGTCGNACNTGAGFSCQAGICKPPPPVPCTGPNTPAGCVPCTGSVANNGSCTPTEQLIVARDIAKGNISGGQLTAGSCYSCLVNAACIDDNGGDTGNECGDLSGTVGAGAQAAETKATACVNTLGCILGIPASAISPAPPEPAADFPGGDVSCGNSSTDGISNCYCGPAFTTTATCSAATGTTVNGVCEQVILDGLGDTTATAPSSVLAAITTKTTASGMADNILKCAGTNTQTPACPVCFQ